MNFFATILLHLLLISSIVFVQSQFPIWPGTYSIVNTAANTLCNQSICCCFTGPITITAAAFTITLSSNVQGMQCNSGTMTAGNTNTTVTTTFSLPSRLVIITSDIGFVTTDIYVLTLSSDSNTLTINDTTNQQCNSIGQRVVVGSGTSTYSNIMSISSLRTTMGAIVANTTIPQSAVNTTRTMSSVAADVQTSQQTNGNKALPYGIDCYLFLSLLVSVMEYLF